MSPWFGSWMGNIFFFLCGLILLWRVDRMPIEIGNLTGGWKLSAAEAAGDRNAPPRMRPAAWELATASHRRRFSARFPLILDDMILRDFALYLTMIMSTFLVLALVFTFFELLTDIVRNRVPLITVAEYLWNLSPSMIYLMAPMGVLLAVLITFGLLEKSSELTAMKATGFSIYRATLPVIVLSGIFAAGLFVFDQLYIPHTNREQEILRNEIKGKPAQTYLQADRKWIFGQSNQIYYYRVFDPDQNIFGGISVFEFDPNTFQLTRRIQAEHAYWDPASAEVGLRAGMGARPEGRVHPGLSHLRHHNLRRVCSEDPGYFKKEVKQSSEMNYDELRSYIDDLQQSGFDTVRLKVQLQKKIAFPLITLVMAMLAIPFAASGRRGGALVGVAVALGIAVVYWVTAGLFEAMGDANQLPAMIAAWAPDFIFALAGGYMLLRVPT